jgi:hypothetical protein
MGRVSQSNPLELIAVHWQRNQQTSGRSVNPLANTEKAGKRLPDRTSQICKSTGNERDSSEHPFKPREALIGASAKLHLPELPLEFERHCRNTHITCAYFTEMKTPNPVGATSLGNLKRHERSRPTGQPSSQITLRPASLIERHCFKEPPRFGTWSIEPLQNRDVIELSMSTSLGVGMLGTPNFEAGQGGTSGSDFTGPPPKRPAPARSGGLNLPRGLAQKADEGTAKSGI